MSYLFAIQFILCAQAPPTDVATAPELRALRWFNNPDYRLRDDRDVILFFFELGSETKAREAAAYVEKLNRLAADPHRVVIGLTKASPSQVERFIRAGKVLFTIGAGSKNAGDFHVSRIPSLLRLDRRAPRTLPSTETQVACQLIWIPLSAGEMDSLLASTGDPNQEQARNRNRWSSWADMDAIDLMGYVESDVDGMARARAVKELFNRVDHDEFADFANARLPIESDPWTRANLQYYSDVARGTRTDDEGQTASAQAFNAYRADPTSAQWSEVRTYEALEKSERSSPQRVWQAYQAHFTSNAADALVRRIAVEDLWHKCPDDMEVQQMLMDVLWAEPDASIRMIATMGLCKKCPTGDEAAAAFIDQMAANEPNIRLTKPVMEYTAHYIRTGDEDPRSMSPRP